jgi:predicted amidohydrolase
VSKFKLGICQLKVTGDKRENLDRARAVVLEAARSGCRVVVLPEMFNCPYTHQFFTRFAETYPEGETFAMLTATAKKSGAYLIGGTIPESENGRVYNTCFVYGPDGKLLGRQRKIHLFDIEHESLVFRESDTLSPGTEIKTFPVPLATFGVAICFDIRFPELSQALTLQGAQVIVVPAAFSTITGPAHWELLLRTRAIDNQVFTVGASPARADESHYAYHGYSMVVNPWGEVIATGGEQETLLQAEIDLDLIDRIRKRLPLLRSQRLSSFNF